jgi:hypothetical protein
MDPLTLHTTDLKLIIRHHASRSETLRFFMTDYQEAETTLRACSKPSGVYGERTTSYTLHVFSNNPKTTRTARLSCAILAKLALETPRAYTEIQPEIYKAPEILVQFIRMGPCGRYLESRLSGKSDSLVPNQSSWYAEPDASSGRCWRPSICSMVPPVRDCTTIAAT